MLVTLIKNQSGMDRNIGQELLFIAFVSLWLFSDLRRDVVTIYTILKIAGKYHRYL